MVWLGWMKVRPTYAFLTRPDPYGMPDSSAYPIAPGVPGLRGRDHEVGLDRVLAGQPAADLDAGGVDPLAGDLGVRAGQVDELEQAALGVRLGEPGRAQPVLVDRDDLARLDLPDEAGADDVEGGGLAGDHPAALEPAQHQRADALRVASGVQGVLVHEDQAVGALDLRQHLRRRLLDGEVRVPGQHRGEDVGVGGGAVLGVRLRVLDLDVQPEVEVVAAVQAGGQLTGVGQVAVVHRARSTRSRWTGRSAGRSPRHSTRWSSTGSGRSRYARAATPGSPRRTPG